MALDLVTGYQGKNHVTAEQWADFNRGVYGDAAILPIGNRMQVEIQTANQITVKDGTGVFDGRQVYIGYGESENIAIESGTQEMLRNDIVVIEYTKDESTGVESAAFKVIAGTPAASDPADPSYQDMDIRTGVFVSQKPFCRVRLNGVAIEGVDMLVEVKEFAAHAFQPPAANLTTTEPGQALDATMGKQLKEGFDQLTSSTVFAFYYESGLGPGDEACKAAILASPHDIRPHIIYVKNTAGQNECLYGCDLDDGYSAYILISWYRGIRAYREESGGFIIKEIIASFS